jgi:TRAP-type C4-dicarboxylate transport system permease small subunit
MIADAVQSLCAWAARIVLALTIAILAIILAVNGMEILARSFLARSFAWIYEVNLLLAAWLYFMGIVLVYRHGGDITMVGLKTILPRHLHDGFDRAVNAASAAVFLVVAWQGWLLIELQWPFRTPGVGIPRIAYTAPLVIGMVLVALQMIADAWRPRRPKIVDDATESEAGR